MGNRTLDDPHSGKGKTILGVRQDHYFRRWGQRLRGIGEKAVDDPCGECICIDNNSVRIRDTEYRVLVVPIVDEMTVGREYNFVLRTCALL